MILGVVASSIQKGIPSFNMANTTYDSKSLLLTSVVTDPYKISFRADKMLVSSGGGWMYLLKNGNTSDLTAYTYNGTDGLKSPNTSSTNGAKFDWNELTYTILTSSEQVHKGTMPSAGNIVGSTFSANSAYTTQTTNSRDFQYSLDGTKFYMLDGTANIIYQYTAGTAFNEATLTYDSKSLSVTGSSPRCLTFTEDGKQVFIGFYATNIVSKYALSTPWDISTGTSHSQFNMTGTVNGVYGIDYINGKLFVLSVTDKIAYQYTLNT